MSLETCLWKYFLPHLVTWKCRTKWEKNLLSKFPFFWCQFCEDCLKIQWGSWISQFRRGTSDWPDFLKVNPFSSEGSHSSVICSGNNGNFCVVCFVSLLTWTWGNTKGMILTSVTRKTELQRGEEDPGFLWPCPPHHPAAVGMRRGARGRDRGNRSLHYRHTEHLNICWCL